MKSVNIRDVPPDTLSALKRLARAHHRSLQGELRDILDRASRVAPAEGEEEDLVLVTVRTGINSTWSREEIYSDAGR